MKKFALIFITESGEQCVEFYDNYHKAMDRYNICTVSLGWYGELYAYEPMDGYTQIM